MKIGCEVFDAKSLKLALDAIFEGNANRNFLQGHWITVHWNGLSYKQNKITRDSAQKLHEWLRGALV